MIDAHCHLGQYKHPGEVLDDDVLVIGVTSSPGEFQRLRRTFKDANNVRLALGMHPNLALRFSAADLRSFDAEALHTSYVGEVGLDFSMDRSTWQGQEVVFRHALRQASRKIVTIHSRRAETRVGEMLAEHRMPSAIFHWYTGGIRKLDELIREGHYFSIGPQMVASVSGRRLAARIPPQQSLVETDGPFARVRGRAARPGDVRLVYEYLAESWSMPLGSAIERVRENLTRLIRPVRRDLDDPAQRSS